VFGGTGNIGKEVLAHLKKKGVKAKTTIQRLTLEKVDMLSALGLNEDDVIDDVNFSEETSYEDSLRGVKKMFFATSYDAAMVEQSKIVVDAAVKVGIKHIVKLSVLGAQLDNPTTKIAKWHKEVEQYIETKGIKYTFVRPNWFDQSVAIFSGDFIKKDKQLKLPMGNGKVSWITAEDIGVVCAEALIDPQTHHGKGYNLTGSEALTCTELAKIFSEEVGTTIEYVDWPANDAKEYYLSKGIPQEWVVPLLELFEASKTAGKADVITSDFEKVTGNKPKTFKQYVQDNVSKFRG